MILRVKKRLDTTPPETAKNFNILSIMRAKHKSTTRKEFLAEVFSVAIQVKIKLSESDRNIRYMSSCNEY